MTRAWKLGMFCSVAADNGSSFLKVGDDKDGLKVDTKMPIKRHQIWCLRVHLLSNPTVGQSGFVLWRGRQDYPTRSRLLRPKILQEHELSRFELGGSKMFPESYICTFCTKSKQSIVSDRSCKLARQQPPRLSSEIRIHAFCALGSSLSELRMMR